MHIITKKIYRIALPSIIGFLGLILFESIDIYWIGHINSSAVAAVGAASFLNWLFYSLMNLSTTGCATLVAQYIGAKRITDKYQVIREAFWLSMIICLVIMFLLLASSRHIFSLMGLDAPTKQYAIQYFTVFIWGLPALYLLNLQGYIFNAHGDTKTSTIIMFFILIVNIVLDPILIFGYLGLPALGVQGAAIASVFAHALGVFIRLYYLRKKEYIPSLNSFGKISTRFFKRLLGIGLPSATTNVVWTIVFPMLTIIITRFGMEPLAALNIAHRIEGFPYFFGVGFSIAISTLVGNSLGENNHPEACQIIKRGVYLISLLLLPVSILFIIFPGELVSLLNQDPAIIIHGEQYLRIVGYFELFMGWELIMEGAFNGLGHTRPYMMVRVPLTLLRIPLAYFLAINLQMGTVGIWWAISATTFIKGLLLVISFVTKKKSYFAKASARL